jgi:hypothetical protein
VEVGEGEGTAVGEGEGEAEGLRAPLRDAEADGVGEGEGRAVREPQAVAEEDRDAGGLRVGVTARVEVEEGKALRVLEGVREEDAEGAAAPPASARGRVSSGGAAAAPPPRIKGRLLEPRKAPSTGKIKRRRVSARRAAVILRMGPPKRQGCAKLRVGVAGAA